MFTRPYSLKLSAECITRRSFSTTTQGNLPLPESSLFPANPPISGISKLSNRRLISLYGQDATRYLQGAITNNVVTGQNSGFYSAFLNAQGRILNDAFIYHTNHSQSFRSSIPQTADPADPSYLIEVDSAEAAKLAKHIKRYKLRSKFDVRLLDEGEWEAWSLWTPPTDRWTPHAIPPDPSAAPTQKYIGCEDTRAPRLGKRIVVQGGSAPEALGKLEETSLDAYTVRRMLYGVPEGQAELLPEVALPLESNIDLMGGIDFQKGCYVGQELTIRTHHTGVVRKRILPVNIYPVGDSVPLALAYDPATKIRDLPPPGTIIVRVGKKGRNIGKWLGGVGNIGLALCRLEVMVEHKDNDKSTPNDVSEEFALEWSDGEVRIKAFVPSWHPQASTLR